MCPCHFPCLLSCIFLKRRAFFFYSCLLSSEIYYLLLPNGFLSFTVLPLITVITLSWCSSCYRRVSGSSFKKASLLDISLVFLIFSYSWLLQAHLLFLLSKPGILHFSKDLWFQCVGGGVFRNEDLCASCAHYCLASPYYL